MYLSFIIPAYNESQRIEKSLEQAIAYFAAQDYQAEILVVDDGSADNTAQVVQQVIEKHGAGRGNLRLLAQPANRGKGAAVRLGMLQAAGDYRVFSDADFSTPIHQTAPMLQHLKTCDVAVGSRALDSSFIKKHQPWYRESMGKMFNLMVQLLAVRGIKDTQCGFKGFTADAARQVFSRTKIDGFSFDVEALFIARRLGLKIVEFPVEWYNDERSTLNPVKDSLKMFRELMRVRALHRTT